jgi:hypothetical protein
MRGEERGVSDILLSFHHKAQSSDLLKTATCNRIWNFTRLQMVYEIWDEMSLECLFSFFQCFGG